MAKRRFDFVVFMRMRFLMWPVGFIRSSYAAMVPFERRRFPRGIGSASRRGCLRINLTRRRRRLKSRATAARAALNVATNGYATTLSLIFYCRHFIQHARSQPVCVAQVSLAADFLGFRTFTAALPSDNEPASIFFGVWILNFAFLRFLWRLDFWCLGFGSVSAARLSTSKR
jgi:hypothetical protein